MVCCVDVERNTSTRSVPYYICTVLCPSFSSTMRSICGICDGICAEIRCCLHFSCGKRILHTQNVPHIPSFIMYAYIYERRPQHWRCMLLHRYARVWIGYHHVVMSLLTLRRVGRWLVGLGAKVFSATACAFDMTAYSVCFCFELLICINYMFSRREQRHNRERPSRRLSREF